MDFEASLAQLRAATHPLPSLPLNVPTHGDATGPMVSPEVQDELAALAPGARYVIATKSGHYIQLQQPELDIEAIRQVVASDRNPDTWYNLAKRV